MHLSRISKALVPILFTSPATAIVGGTPAPSSYSYTAALMQNCDPFLPSPTDFICTAILISPCTALTAAECVTDLSPSDVHLRIGTSPSTQTNITITSITTMSDFNYTSLNNDLAILKLAEEESHIKPAVIARPNATLPLPPAAPLKIAGWGPTSADYQGIASCLHVADVTTVIPSACAAALGSCGFGFDGCKRLCTTSGPGGMAAYGDAGGPVVDGDGVVRAIITGGPGCAQPDGLAVVLRLDEGAVAGFIASHL